MGLQTHYRPWLGPSGLIVRIPESTGMQERIRIAKITSVARIGVELGKLYRGVRLGKIDSTEAVRMTTILLGMKQCMETAELEQRMSDIEAAIAARANQPSTFKPKIVS
jgi:hypothetical protein